MGWTFLYLMVFLKLPIVGLFCIVRWAIKQTPETEPTKEGEGGSRKPRHPRPALPRPPRRGPHGERAIPAPPRTRTVVARARTHS